LIGDAAHAHGGAFATGGSLAIDDAYAFSLALGSVFPYTATKKPSPEEIHRALRLYEATRKPHAERLLKVVHAANKAKAAKFALGERETDEELRARATKGSNTSWLHEHDVVKAFEETLLGAPRASL
jgi:salicylate hydroxylase